MRKVIPHIPQGASLLDIGCGDGALLRRLQGWISVGMGIDPAVQPSFHLFRGYFPQALPSGHIFDVITCLATLEHIPEAHLPLFCGACISHLRPGGILLFTVPSPAVDVILKGLRCLRLVDGMSLEEHHGFDTLRTPHLFPTLSLTRHQRFQLGLNNLFVFTRAVA